MCAKESVGSTDWFQWTVRVAMWFLGTLLQEIIESLLLFFFVRINATEVGAIEANFLMGRCSMFGNDQLTFDKYTWVMP